MKTTKISEPKQVGTKKKPADHPNRARQGEVPSGLLRKVGEDSFGKVFAEGPMGMALADRQYHFIQVNPTFCRLLGYSERELKKLTFKDISHPDDMESSVKNVRDLERGKLPVYKTDKRYITKKKAVIWGALTLSTILDQDGELQFFLVMIEDITHRKRGEDSLHESEDKFKYLFDYSIIGKSITKPSGEFQPNEAFCEMLGYSPKELQKKRWQDLTHPDDIALNQKEVAAILAGEKEFPVVISPDTVPGAAHRMETFFPNKFNELTSREQKILKLMAKGMTNKDISVRLGLSMYIVKANLTTLFAKLGVSSRTEAISISLKSGIITINDF